jgi:tetratricopeptide (TPR) repeat protein
MYLYRFGKAVAINGLAAQAEQSGRRQQAESLFGEALRVLLEIHGPDDPILRDQLRILRQYCYQRRDWQCAEDYARKVVELDAIDAKRGGNVSDVGSAGNLQSLAALCAQEGRLGEAATHYAEALKRLDRALPQNDRLIVGCLESYAIVLAQMGREAESDVVRERVRKAREATPRRPD